MYTPFYDESLERGVSNHPDKALMSEFVAELLASEQLNLEIDAGNLTVAMIRPNLAGNTLNNTWSDRQAADAVEESIQNLGVLAKFAITFDATAVDQFYGGGPRDVQLSLAPERFSHYETRWHEFVDLMLSGPTTVLLLHSPNGDAIKQWRDQVGHYDIVSRRDPSTIRGTLGRDNYNNLIHGSDSTEAVNNEIGIIRRLLRTA